MSEKTNRGGRPRKYNPDRPATAAERKAAQRAREGQPIRVGRKVTGQGKKKHGHVTKPGRRSPEVRAALRQHRAWLRHLLDNGEPWFTTLDGRRVHVVQWRWASSGPDGTAWPKPRKVWVGWPKGQGRTRPEPRRWPLEAFERDWVSPWCAWCGGWIERPVDDCATVVTWQYTDGDLVFSELDHCLYWDADDESCDCGTSSWTDALCPRPSCPCQCMNCAGRYWPYCSSECRRHRHRYGTNYVWMPSGGRPLTPGEAGRRYFGDRYYIEKIEAGLIAPPSDSAYRGIKKKAPMEDNTEREREAVILALMGELGLDGYAATAAADDPDFYETNFALPRAA